MPKDSPAKSAVKAALDIALPASKEASEWQAYLNHVDKNIRWEAFKLAMAYRHGKPVQPVSGAPIDNEPIKVSVDYMGASPEFFAKMAAKLGLK